MFSKNTSDIVLYHANSEINPKKTVQKSVCNWQSSLNEIDEIDKIEWIEVRQAHQPNIE